MTSDDILTSEMFGSIETTPKSDWLFDNLIESMGNFVMEKLGTKRTILHIPMHRTLIGSLIQGKAPVEDWIRTDNNPLETIFTALDRGFSNISATWFFLTMLDGAVLLLREEIDAIDIAKWGDNRLWGFETFQPAEGDGQYLLLLSDTHEAVVMFSRENDGLEIAYYGPDDLWEKISAALYGNSQS